jgi:23S rRNA pseudouridine955/2504/2580 synthase
MLKRVAVLYEDSSCIVLNKPVGLAVQGGKGIGVSLDSILAENWPQRPLLVHRLDRDTSGVILVAKTKAAAAFFSQLFDNSNPRSPVPSPQSPQKQYLAMCKGTPLTNEGVITLDLAIHGNIKKSVTHFRLLNEFSNGAFSLLELELGTGRMHQIRRHLAGTGNPVLGDDKYGDFSLNRSLRTTMQVRKLLLHASRLVIPAMPDGSCLDISAPLPDHFQHCIDRLSSGHISNIP